MRLPICLILLLSLLLACTELNEPIDPLQAAIKQGPKMLTDMIDSAEYEIQIIYTQINRDRYQYPHMQSFYIGRDDDRYFYPASTVKMPVAFLAMQRINELHLDISEIDLSTPIYSDAGTPPQSAVYIDSSALHGYPNVGHYIEQIFSVSDNDAYNRLYEFLGQDYINEQLHEKGIFRNSRIRTRVGVSGFDTEANKYTNPIRMVNQEGRLLYQQDEYYALYDTFDTLSSTDKGIGYWDDHLDTTVYQAFDLSQKNFINLTDLESTLRRVIFPSVYEPEEQFNLRYEDYNFLYETMPRYPLSYPFHQDHGDEYYDSYVKFFINGDSKESIPEHIKVYNKVGWAYGTLTDCSYIIDTQNKLEFFLTATILVNKNQIFNDGQYEYNEKGLPFLSALGEAIYNYELDRKRPVEPDFSKLGY